MANALIMVEGDNGSYEAALTKEQCAELLSILRRGTNTMKPEKTPSFVEPLMHSLGFDIPPIKHVST